MNIALIAHDKKKELMVDFCIAYSGLRSQGSGIQAVRKFQLVYEIDLSMGLPMLKEGIFMRTKKNPYGRIHTKFLLHLTHKRDAPGLSELDVSAGQICGLAALRATKKQFSVLYAYTTCNRLYSDNLIFIHR